MEWYLILLLVLASILLVLLLASVLVSFFLAYYLSFPKRYSLEETLECDKEKGLLEEQLSWKKEEMNFTMEDGYLLHGDFYPQEKNKIIVFVHGYTWTRYGGLKYAPIFYENGYSLYLYDERGHGANKRVPCTMGKKESGDLHSVLAHLKKKFPEAEIGVHGESLGAATSLEALKYQDDIRFVIADSPYEDLHELLQDKCRQFHLPIFLLPLVALFVYLFAHYKVKDVSPKKALMKSKVPVLLITSSQDTMIQNRHAVELSQIRKENTYLHIFPNVEHTKSLETYPKEYREVVNSFLEDIHAI